MSRERFCCPGCGKTYTIAEIKQNDYACLNSRCPLNARLMVHGEIGANGNVSQIYGWVLQKGAVLNQRYVVEKMLGKGGFGATYLARDRKMFDKLRAIKEIPISYFDEQEEEFLSILEHPAIPQLIERFNLKSLHYSVMEYVEGRGLDELVFRSKTGLPETEVLEIAGQICDVLHYIHSQKIIHRDLKPENILITREKTIALIDFGISKRFDIGKGTRRLARAASSFFSSPEQYQAGKGYTDVKSDIYSFGAILYFLLTGKEPVDALSRDSKKDISPKPRELNPLISVQVEKVIIKAMKMQKQQRYSGVNQLKKALLGDRQSLTQICSKCGAVIRKPANYCPNCGYSTRQLPDKNHTFFTFRTGDRVTTLKEFIAKCYQNWEDAKFHLVRGDFNDWLIAKNEKSLARKAKQCVKRQVDADILLNDFLNNSKYGTPPKIQIQPRKIDLKEIPKGVTKRVKFNIQNIGKGLLYGKIKVPVKWLTLSQDEFKCIGGKSVSIVLKIDSQNLKVSKEYQTKIIIETAQEKKEIPVSFTLAPAPAMQKISPSRFVVQIKPDKSVTEFIDVKNIGNDEVLNWELVSKEKWIQIKPVHFKARRKKIRVKINGKKLKLGQHLGKIFVASDAGKQVVPVELSIKKYITNGVLKKNTRSEIFKDMVQPILIMFGIVLGIFYLGKTASAQWGEPGIIALFAAIGGLIGLRKGFWQFCLALLVGGAFGFGIEYGLYYAYHFLDQHFFRSLCQIFLVQYPAQANPASWAIVGVFIGGIIGLFKGFVLVRHLWTYFLICFLGFTILMGIIFAGFPVLFSG